MLLPSVPGVFGDHDSCLADGRYHIGPGLQLIALQLDQQPALPGGYVVGRQVVQGVGHHVRLAGVAGAADRKSVV